MGREADNIATFVESCNNFESNVSFHNTGAINDFAKNVLIIGTSSQLKDKEGVAKGLPFDGVEVQCALSGAKNSSLCSTFAKKEDGSCVRVAVGAVPQEASRHNCAARPDVITSLVQSAISDAVPNENADEGKHLDIIALSPDVLAVANAVARANVRNFSAKKGLAEKNYLEKGATVRVVLRGSTSPANTAHLNIVAKYVQLCQRLVDAPTNLLYTTTFADIAAAYGKKLGLDFTCIAGEELMEQGYGGLYGVGKAAQHPAHLVTLHYSAKAHAGVSEPTNRIAFVGKGIVYDTGGLSIKSGPFMCGMKHDMGGAAAVLCGFLAAAEMKVDKDLAVTLCLADNAVGPLSQRNDDIVLMKSGLTIEINNTDAEGRLVLGDGVYYAATSLPFTPDTVIDMATLTGAQGIATGKHHAAIFTDSGEWETRMCDAGRICGDLCFPILYCPEFHNPEFSSKVADYRNSVSNRSNAQCSCAGSFIGNNLPKNYEGSWVHVDLASPATRDEGTGFGVSLIAQLIGNF